MFKLSEKKEEVKAEGKTTILKEKEDIPISNIPIQGKIVRSSELEKVASEMKNTPCLCPVPEKIKMHVESGGFVSKSIDVPSIGQLPADLALELEEIATSKTIFPPPLKPLKSMFEKPKIQNVVRFNLEEFNK